MKKYFNGIPIVVYSIALFIQSTMPITIKAPFNNFDKLVHFGMYFVWTYLFSHAVFHQNKYLKIKENWIVYVLFFSLINGLFEETRQIFVPGRSADIMDLNADFMGSLIAVFLFKLKPTKSFISS